MMILLISVRIFALSLAQVAPFPLALATAMIALPIGDVPIVLTTAVHPIAVKAE
jgi:hypothetical protein